jgi:hypothetical protein
MKCLLVSTVLLLLLTGSTTLINGEAFDQELPDCREPYETIKKITTKTALTCAMIRNEEGFLAEWIGFYQMHGFDHIVLFDHDSSDQYRKEIQPWLNTGFVTVYTYNEWPAMLGYHPKTKKTFLEKMVS